MNNKEIKRIKKDLKKMRKGIDKQKKVCYNKGIEKINSITKKFQKVSKNY